MPIRVYDKENDATVEVDAATAREGFAKGRFEIRDRVNVRKGLQTGDVSGAELGRAIADGWEPIEPEEVQRLRIKREESDAASSAVGLLEQAASGASLGLSDILETEVFGVDSERMAARADATGSLGTLAYLGGAIAPAFMSGGATTGVTGGSLAARGLGGLARAGIRGVGAPVRALEALGGLAERGVARAFGQEVGGMAGLATRGIIEGAGQEVGAQIHENVLGNREWNAELLSAGINGGFLGGTIGMAIPGIARVAGGRARLPEAATAQVLARQVDGSPRNFGTVAKYLSGGSAKKAESIESALLDLTGDKARANLQYRAVYERDDLIRETGEGVVKATGEMNEAIRAARIETEGTFKRANLQRLLPQGADDVVPRMVREEVRKLHPQIKGAQDLAAKYKGEYFRVDIDEVADRLRKLDADLEGASAADAYLATQQTVRDIGEKIGKLKKTAFSSEVSSRTLDEIRKIHRALKGGDEGAGILGNSAIWGDDVAGMYNEITAADRLSMTHKAGLLGRDGRGRNALGRLLDDATPLAMKTEDAIAFAKQVGKPKGAVTGETLDATFQAEIEALRARAKHYDDPAFKQRLETVEKAYANYKSTMGTMSQAADMLDTYKDLGQGGSVSGLLTAFGPSGAAVTGGLIGGIPGAMLGAAVNVIARPQQAMRTAIGIRHLLDQVDGSIGESVGRFLSGMRAKAPKASRASEKAARAFGFGKVARKTAIAGATLTAAKSRSERQERAQTFQNRAQMFATSPDALVKELGPLMFDVDQAAPGLAGHLQANVQRAAMFLASKQPAVYSDPYTGKPPVVDAVTLSKYERYVEAIADPIGVLDKLASGQVTVEHAEALRAVYPLLYERVQGKVLEELGAAAEEGRPIPYARRVQVGIAFQIPTDWTLRPEALVRLAAGTGQAQQEAAEQDATVKAAKIDSADRKMSTIDRLESGAA